MHGLLLGVNSKNSKYEQLLVLKQVVQQSLAVCAASIRNICRVVPYGW